jgi:sulfate adenylyltransferase subunit 2
MAQAPNLLTRQSHLDALESQSLFIFREAYHHFERLCMPWSMGKDSNVLIWLAKKAFCGHMPFPLLHIDTTYEFPEMIEFREWAVEHHGINLIVKINEDARYGRGTYNEPISYETHDPVTVTHELKTVALQQVMAEHRWDALITGIRRDEDPTRAKERYFSPRTKDFEWDYKDQPPEFWNQFTTSCGPGEHVRVQPLLDWTEVDIWRYIQREEIPIPQMYFARPGKDGELYRYRSLGCWPITHPIKSAASNIDEVIAELEVTKTSERAGRAQDHHERNAMQKLRAKGFM